PRGPRSTSAMRSLRHFAQTARRGKKCSPQSSQREPRSRGGSAGSSGTVKYPSLTGTLAPAIVVRPNLVPHRARRRRRRLRLTEELVLRVVVSGRRRIAPHLGRHVGAPGSTVPELQAQRDAALR